MNAKLWASRSTDSSAGVPHATRATMPSPGCCRAAGYGVTIVTPEGFDRGSIIDAMSDLTSHTVAGVITVFPSQQAATNALFNLPAGLPAVAVEAAPDESVPTVRIDQAEGVRMAVEHLLRLGHSTVWHVSGPRERMALGLLRAFHELGVRVPQEVSVVGFDDIPEPGYLIPPLTTVRPDHGEVGRRTERPAHTAQRDQTGLTP